MKVKGLVEILQQQDQDLQVSIGGEDSFYVYYTPKRPSILIDVENEDYFNTENEKIVEPIYNYPVFNLSGSDHIIEQEVNVFKILSQTLSDGEAIINGVTVYIKEDNLIVCTGVILEHGFIDSEFAVQKLWYRVATSIERLYEWELKVRN